MPPSSDAEKLTRFRAVTAIHVEGLVASVDDLPVGGVEDQTVRAELLHRLALEALVVLVTLHRILVQVVLGVRALEGCPWNEMVEKNGPIN